MRSTNLSQFVLDRGVQKTVEVWGVSRQAIAKAINEKRDIQIVELDDCIEVRESKVLQRVRVK